MWDFFWKNYYLIYCCFPKNVFFLGGGKHKIICLHLFVYQHYCHYNIKETKKINKTILKHLTTTFLFGWRFFCLEDEQKPVWPSLLILCQKPDKIYPQRILKLLSHWNKHIGHQDDVWKKGSCILKIKFNLLLNLKSF